MSREDNGPVNQAEQVFIPCNVVGDGMFPTEVTIEIRTVDGQAVTLLADKSLLSTDPPGVRATRVSTEEGVSICLLPTEDPSTGSRWVRIRSEDVKAA